MPDAIEMLMKRARNCPFACLLKIIFILMFVSAIYIALFHQTSVSPYMYNAFVAAIGFVAVLALATNRNCRLKLIDYEEEQA